MHGLRGNNIDEKKKKANNCILLTYTGLLDCASFVSR